MGNWRSRSEKRVVGENRAGQWSRGGGLSVLAPLEIKGGQLNIGEARWSEEGEKVTAGHHHQLPDWFW